MSWYDEENPLLVRPRPFWEEEEEPVVPVVQPVAPPAAPPPEVEGPGYASLQDIAAVPEVEGPGFAGPEEILGVEEPPEVEGPGYASLEEIGAGEPEKESFLHKAARTGYAAAQMLLPNVSQAAAVLDPDTQKKAIDVADKTKNSLRSGWISGDVAIELQKQNPSLDYVAQQQGLIDTLKPDKDFETAWNDKASAKESLDAFLKDPAGNIAQLFGQSMGAMIRSSKDYLYKIPERTLQGGIAGAGVGAPIAGVGAVPGALLGARGGFTLGMAEMNSLASYANEYAGSIISSLQESGVDVKDAEQLKRAFSDPQLMTGIRAKAEKKGVPVAFFDGLSGAVDGNLFAKPGKTLGKKAWEWTAELLTESAFGGGGEAASQLASEGKIASWRSILAEIGMEPVSSVPQVAVGRAMGAIGALSEAPTVTAPTVPGAVEPAVPPPLSPTPPEAFAPPGYVEVPGMPPGEQPAMVNLGPGAPPVTPPVSGAVEPGPATPAGEAVTQHVGAENLAVRKVAQEQAQNLQASGAPKTAEAIQQVASRSNAGASVSAAEFLAQAKVQAADEATEAVEQIAKAVPEAVTPEAAAPAEAPPVAAPVPLPQALAVAPTPAPTTEGAQPPAAVVVGGQVFTGDTHEQAVQAAHTAVGTDAMTSASTGWVDPESGRFVSHEIYEGHQALNTAIEQAGGNMEHPAVAEAQAQLAEAQARDEELNQQIVSPGGEQVVASGVKGQEALIAVRPSQELAVPLSGVNVTVEGVTPDGKRIQGERPAAQALNDARNDKTAFTLLLDCLT